MNYFVHYDNITGEFKGFYSEEMHGTNIPVPNIVLTEAQWIDAHGNQHLRKVDVVNLVVVEVAPTVPTTEDLLVPIRVIRNEKLTKTDWTRMDDNSLTIEQKALYATYRQALRDFPSVCDPANPVWPTEPTI